MGVDSNSLRQGFDETAAHDKHFTNGTRRLLSGADEAPLSILLANQG
jgi:hypothetical protein